MNIFYFFLFFQNYSNINNVKNKNNLFLIKYLALRNLKKTIIFLFIIFLITELKGPNLE